MNPAGIPQPGTGVYRGPQGLQGEGFRGIGGRGSGERWHGLGLQRGVGRRVSEGSFC